MVVLRGFRLCGTMVAVSAGGVSAQQLATFKPGDAVTWLYTPRGGYGYRIPVDAIVRKLGARRVQIEAPLASGALRLIWVTPEKLVASGAAAVLWLATEDGSTGKGTGRHIAAFILRRVGERPA